MVKTILIIDDEKSVRKTLSIFFTSEGYEVITAADLKTARNFILDSDIVLLDIRLPDGNGIYFLRELKAQGIDKPVLLMSCMTNSSENEMALDLTGQPVIEKPAEFQEVLKIVEKTLAGKD